MDKATKSLPVALHRGFLTAMGARRAVNVFRADLSTGEQFFFATSTPAAQVGHADAIERIPRGRVVSHLVRVAVIDATETAFPAPRGSTLTHGSNAECPDVVSGIWTRCHGHAGRAE